MQKIVKNVYISVNGQEFATEKECLDYEQSLPTDEEAQRFGNLRDFINVHCIGYIDLCVEKENYLYKLSLNRADLDLMRKQFANGIIDSDGTRQLLVEHDETTENPNGDYLMGSEYVSARNCVLHYLIGVPTLQAQLRKKLNILAKNFPTISKGK